jgi:hypothetical protein
VLEEFLLCKLVGECMDVLNPREDGAEIAERDGMTRVEFLAEQDEVFENFLGGGSDRYAHGPP